MTFEPLVVDGLPPRLSTRSSKQPRASSLGPFVLFLM